MAGGSFLGSFFLGQYSGGGMVPAELPTAPLTGLYYPSEAFHGYGTQLLVGNNGAPELYMAIAELNAIAPGGMTTATHERTHLRSPEAHREKRPGLRESEPFTVSGNWRPAHESQSNAGGGLIALWRTGAETNFMIVLPNGSEFPFHGVVNKFKPGQAGRFGVTDFKAEMLPLRDFSATWP